MKKIKNSLIKKKSNLKTNRSVQLKKPNLIKSILLVVNEKNKSIKQIVETQFSTARVHLLYTRDVKIDSSEDFYISTHYSDFNLTGQLKNDKLINLNKMSFELLIDLSKNSNLLDFFIKRSTANLKVGAIDSEKTKNYDLLVDAGTTNHEYIKNIYNHLITLTENEQI